jgi:hypothetical protein
MASKPKGASVRATASKPSEGDFIRDPDHWPQWPRLPLKKGPWPDRVIGFLCDNGGLDGPLPEPVRVYHGNIWADFTETPPFTEYATVDDLLGAGWEVD